VPGGRVHIGSFTARTRAPHTPLCVTQPPPPFAMAAHSSTNAATAAAATITSPVLAACHEAAAALEGADFILFAAGAGCSADSGLRTFQNAGTFGIANGGSNGRENVALTYDQVASLDSFCRR
jgi:hypothetical protein